MLRFFKKIPHLFPMTMLWVASCIFCFIGGAMYFNKEKSHESKFSFHRTALHIYVKSVNEKDAEEKQKQYAFEEAVWAVFNLYSDHYGVLKHLKQTYLDKLKLGHLQPVPELDKWIPLEPDSTFNAGMVEFKNLHKQ